MPHQARRAGGIATLLLCLASAVAARGGGEAESASPGSHRYRPPLRPAPSLEAVLRHLAPGADDFPDEKEAQELAGRLELFSKSLRERPEAAAEALAPLLAPEFRGGRLAPDEEQSLGGGPHLEVFRGRVAPELRLDRASFAGELSGLLAELRRLDVAEFLITSIEVAREGDPVADTRVRYDIAGAGKQGGRAERLGEWRMRWRRGGSEWRIVEWSTLEHTRSRASQPLFTEVTEAALGGNPTFDRQLRPGHDAWLEVLDSAFAADTMGLQGMSAGDFDGDGLDDLYLAQPTGLPGRLFRNRGDGTFEDATEIAGVGILDGASHSLFADVDNDGDQDLVIVARTGLLLLRSDGKGHFTRDPDAFRFKTALRGSPTAIAMADYDRDGFLDLYLCTYSYFIGASEDKSGPAVPYHDARNGPPNVLFRNDGRGRFVDVTDAAGMSENNDRFSLAAAWADYDADGWPDLLVANDFGSKNLYRNRGPRDGSVTFEDVAKKAGVEDPGAGMSATWLDHDNDGRLDIYTGNMWTSAGLRVTAQPGFMPGAPPEVRQLYRRHARGNSLLRNRGDGGFDDVTLDTRTQMGRWAWSSDALDFDLDGWEDLYVVNGMFTREGGPPDLDSFFWRQVTARSPLAFRQGSSFDDGWRAINRLLVAEGAQAAHERNVLLRNNGRGGFDEVSGSVGLDLDQDGRSFVALDYDRDGDPDLFVYSPRSSPQLRVFRNDFPEPSAAALAVRLTGRRSNRDAAGARVSVETEHGRQTRVVMLGSGFLSQRPKELLFGLGGGRRVRELEVVWPSGVRQSFHDLPADTRFFVEEGAEALRSEPIQRRAQPSAAHAQTVRASNPGGSPVLDTWLYEPFPAPDFTLRDLAGQERSLSALRGKPALILFWATEAPASRAALEALATGRAALAAAGISVLAVATDPDEAKVKAASAGLALPVAASPEAATIYAILNRYLAARREGLRLPTAFLLSARGEIVRVYRDSLEPSRIVQDAGRIEAGPSERLARAAPFPGTFHTIPGHRNYFQYALELAEQGFEAPALAAFQRAAELDPGPITLYNLGTLHAKRGQPAKARAAFERALELKPDYAEANNSLGALLAQTGDVASGIARFRKALAVRPDFPDALNNLGFALLQTHEEQKAHELFQKALALQPGLPEALNNLGIFFGQQGDLERAETYFRQAVENRPGYGEAANNLALVLSARGETAAAIELLQRLLEQAPAFENAYVTLSKIHLGAGRRREGIQVLERLLQRNPRHPVGLQVLREARGGR